MTPRDVIESYVGMWIDGNLFGKTIMVISFPFWLIVLFSMWLTDILFDFAFFIGDLATKKPRK